MSFYTKLHISLVIYKVHQNVWCQCNFSGHNCKVSLQIFDFLYWHLCVFQQSVSQSNASVKCTDGTTWQKYFPLCGCPLTCFLLSCWRKFICLKWSDNIHVTYFGVKNLLSHRCMGVHLSSSLFVRLSHSTATIGVTDVSSPWETFPLSWHLCLRHGLNVASMCHACFYKTTFQHGIVVSFCIRC